MTTSQVHETTRALAGLPPAADPKFPAEIRRLVENLPDPEPILHAILADKRVSHRTRFVALYGVLLRLRREERYGDYAGLVREHESEFGDEPYFLTFQAIVARLRGAEASALRTAVEYSRRAAELMPDVAGVLHQVAAFTVEYLELSDTPQPTLLGEAERHVEAAIAVSWGKIGHYFETKARILAMQGQFSAARHAVGQAIELEPRGSRDYTRRITQYQTTRTRIELLAERSRWLTSQEEFRSELGRFRTQQLELLGLLAAVVAFVVTAGNIASRASPRDGVRLIIVMSGCVILIFATFSLMTSHRAWRIVAAATLGTGLLLLGLLAPRLVVR